MSETADVRTWFLLVLSVRGLEAGEQPKPRMVELAAQMEEKEPLPQLRWRSLPRSRLGALLFDERRYLHPFAWRLLEEQTFLSLDGLRDPDPRGSALRLQLGDGDEATPHPLCAAGGEPLLRVTEAYLHLFDDGVVVCGVEVEGEGIAVDEILNFHVWFRKLFRAFAAERPLLSLGFRGITEGEEMKPAIDAAVDVAGTAPEALIAHTFISRLLQPLQDACNRLGLNVVHDGAPRMHVHSWLRLGRITETLWGSALWVDNPPEGSFSAGERFGKELTARHTYDRWSPSTLFGFTRYSSMIAGVSSDRFFSNVIREQAGEVYYSLLLIHLVHRRLLLDLSDRCAEIASGIRHAGANREKEMGDVTRLREDLTMFVARHWFEQFSHQEQGVEISRRMAEALDTPKLLTEVQEEVKELEEWLRLSRDGNFQETVSKVGVVVGTGSLIAGAWGANASDFWPEWGGVSDEEFTQIFVGGSTLVILTGIFWLWRSLQRGRVRSSGRNK